MVGELEDHQLELEAYVLPNEKIPDHCSIASFQVSTSNVFFFILLASLTSVLRKKILKKNFF